MPCSGPLRNLCLRHCSGMEGRIKSTGARFGEFASGGGDEDKSSSFNLYLDARFQHVIPDRCSISCTQIWDPEISMSEANTLLTGTGRAFSAKYVWIPALRSAPPHLSGMTGSLTRNYKPSCRRPPSSSPVRRTLHPRKENSWSASGWRFFPGPRGVRDRRR